MIVIHTYIHTCIHTYMHACMHTYIHTYIVVHKIKPNSADLGKAKNPIGIQQVMGMMSLGRREKMKRRVKRKNLQQPESALQDFIFSMFNVGDVLLCVCM